MNFFEIPFHDISLAITWYQEKVRLSMGNHCMDKFHGNQLINEKGRFQRYAAGKGKRNTKSPIEDENIIVLQYKEDIKEVQEIK